MANTITWKLDTETGGFEKGTAAASKGLGKLDKDVESTSLKAAKFAGGVDMVSKKLAGLGEAAGLPASALRTLSDVGDVAQIGLENLGKGAAGFNAASLGAAGAGLALGTAIGTWLNTFPAVQQAADSLVHSIYELATGADLATERAAAMSGLGKFTQDMGRSNEEAVKRQIEGQLKHGATIQQLAERYKTVQRETKTASQIVDEMAAKHTKAAAAAKKHADEWAAIVKPFKELTQAAQRSDMDVKLMAAFEALGPLSKATVNDVDAVAQALAKMGQEGQEAARDLVRAWEGVSGIDFLGRGKNLGGLLGSVPGLPPELKKGTREITLDLEDIVQKTHVWQDELLTVADVFARIGGRAGGLIADTLSGVVGVADSLKTWKDAGAGFGGFLSKLGAGGGIAATVFGIGKNLLGGLFGGEEKEVNRMRDAQLAALGGWQKVHKELAAAGNEGLMKKIFDAKSVNDFNAAMGQAQGVLGLMNQAQNERNAAAEKYGLLTQNQIQLDGARLLKEHELLATQFTSKEILSQMAPAINEWLQTALKAGDQIPAEFKPILEQMAGLGLLTNASGEAVDNLADAGVTSFGAFSDAAMEVVKVMRELVDVLRQAQGLGPLDVAGGGGGGGGRFRGSPEDFERMTNPRHGEGGGVSTTWGEPWMLHGSPQAPEFVLTSEQMRALRGGGGGGGGGGSPAVHIQIGPQAIRDFIVREVRNGNMPGLG